ncbi:VOC family protein [uncultured Cellulomonas sp.]|uniref:VOC family protein n=1 Tax=uncultured Cellulomonas sp. TaxID=189682 RepID=UPI0028E8663B|nr:VOC family protein [uncultured Cellulomonas sp.]
MISGLHVLLASSDPAADRAFLRDVLGWSSVEDATSGDGWLIFALPPAELGVHPGDSADGATLHLMCEDLDGTLADLATKGVRPLDPPHTESWGVVTRIPLPSGGSLGLYEPQHPSPLGREPITRHAGLELSLSTTVLEARDANALADFYRRLLGWRVMAEEPGWVMLRPPSGGTGISFSSDPLYETPVWPATTDHQQMMEHLDIWVNDLDRGVEHALAEGATLAGFQPQDEVRVMLDPAGHPFCLFES